MNNVESYYDLIAEKENKRLTKDAYHTLEFLVSMHYLKKYLPKKGYVLDLGCGPGPYSVALGKNGYNLALLDLSKSLLDTAVKNMKKNKVISRVKEVVHGSATDLSMFEKDTFDAVLCFGPMYHLKDIKDQEKMLKEIRRVAKPGAKIFIAAVSYYGVLTRILIKYPHELLLKSREPVFRAGVHKQYDKASFPDAKFFKPDELAELVERCGFESVELFANEGLSTNQEEATNKLHRNKKRWNKWIKLLIKNSNVKSLVGFTEHFVLVAKNKK